MQKLVAIVGPTASGKTDMALALAKKFHGYIICADSRTMYQEMNIATAKPYISHIAHTYTTNASPTWDINSVPHYGLDLIPPTESFSAAQFKEYVDHIVETNDPLPFLVGGTGFYISAVIDNLSFPDVPPNPKFRKEKEALPLSALVSELLHHDPEAGQRVDLKNKRRVIRGLEIIHATGTIQYSKKGTPIYDALIIGITRKREELYSRINQRVDEMVKNGLLDEFEALYQKYGCAIPGMTGIGYTQLCLWKQGTLSLVEALEKFKQKDRNLAKRQITWFKRDKRIHWVQSLTEAESVIRPWLL